MLFGDSTALTLGWSLGAKPLATKYNYSFQDLGSLGCGVALGTTVRARGKDLPEPSTCNGLPVVPGTPLDGRPWPVQWQTHIAISHPNVVVLLAGRWEVVDRTYQGAWTNILHPAYADYVKDVLEYASKLVAATGANMVFMTAPCIDEAKQPNGTPWPENQPARLAEYNKLVGQVAAENPTTDSVVNLDGVVCPHGKFDSKYKGVTIRDSDGVHFKLTAGLILAPALMPPIVASGRAQMARLEASGTGS
jgi:hypothetical protein